MISKYIPENIRNLCIIGHNKTGKTTILESLLYLSGTIDKMGSIDRKNTVSDFEPSEKKMGVSIHNSVVNCETNDIKINLIDTPGLNDFIGLRYAGRQFSLTK